MANIRNFIDDTRGDGLIVEATFIFPIMIMFLAAIVLMSIYLPQRSLMQEAAQIAAVAVATDRSDTWITFDAHGNRIPLAGRPDNVYIVAFRGRSAIENQWSDRVQEMVENHIASGIGITPNSDIAVNLHVINYFIYQSVTVTVTQTISVPINLSFIGFPREVVLIQEARAVVPNGAEFVRNIDIAMDLMDWVRSRFGEESDFGGTIDTARRDGVIGDIFLRD